MLNGCECLLLLRFALFLIGLFGRIFLNVLRNFLHVFLELVNVFRNFLNIFLNFFEVFGHFVDVFLNLVNVLFDLSDGLALVVDSHLYKNREVNRLERYNRGQKEEHAVKGYVPECGKKKAARKENGVDDDGCGGAHGACDFERRFLYAFGICHIVKYSVRKKPCHCVLVWYAREMVQKVQETEVRTGPVYAGAYLVRGTEAHFDALRARLVFEGVIRESSPDLYARSYRKFGVDESHDITGRARTRAIDLEQRVFILFIPGITNEAQNALLKTIEEPAANALFFIVTPSPEMLLPTVLSRVQPLSIEITKGAPATSGLHVDAAEFLATSPDKRLAMLKPLYDYDEDEGRDIGAVIAFLQDVEARLGKLSASEDKAEALKALYRARGFVGDKGSLLKALLEQMALLIPRL